MMTRKDYIATAEILKYASNKTHPALFSKMVNDFAEMFAKENGSIKVVEISTSPQSCGVGRVVTGVI